MVDLRRSESDLPAPDPRPEPRWRNSRRFLAVRGASPSARFPHRGDEPPVGAMTTTSHAGRMFVLERSHQADFEDKAIVLMPLRGMIRVQPGAVLPSVVCAGRGLYLPQPGTTTLIPHGLTGCLLLVLVLDAWSRDFVHQGLPPWSTAFDTMEFLIDTLPEIEPLLGSDRQSITLETSHDFFEFLLWQYGRHREAFLRLPGKHEHRRGLYARLLLARQLCEAEPETRIGRLGHRVHLSQAHFGRLFRSVFGHGPQQHLIRFRIARAMNLLAWTDLTISEIAVSCGYHDRTAFSRAFGKQGSLAPADFRRRMRHARGPIGSFFELGYEMLP